MINEVEKMSMWQNFIYFKMQITFFVLSFTVKQTWMLYTTVYSVRHNRTTFGQIFQFIKEPADKYMFDSTRDVQGEKLYI